MEFGIFLNGYIPGPAAHDTELGAHDAHARGRVRDPRRQAQLEVRLVRRAPLPHRVQPHVGARGRHGLRRRRRPTTSTSASAINSLSPRKEHPVRFAERAAMLDHVTNNRYEWGTGRGAGSHEVASVQHPRHELDQGRVGRGRPARSRACGSRSDYAFDGEHFTVPYAAQHPPEAVRQGSPADLGGVRQPAHVRPGRRARHRCHRLQLRADLQPAGPHRGLQGGDRQLHRADRPVQERQRDDDQRGDLPRGPQARPARSRCARAAATSSRW